MSGPTKADLIAQRDRARYLVRTMLPVLDDEHSRNCACGRVDEGDCRTRQILHGVQAHVDHWGEPPRSGNPQPASEPSPTPTPASTEGAG